MSLSADPYAPISPEEEAAAPKAARGADRVPIVPVPDDAPPFNFQIPKLGGAPKQTWAYRDETGRLLFYDARFEYEQNGKTAKDVLPVAYCQTGEKRAWRSKGLPGPRPLYGLDRLAARPEATVVIAEGCKCADATEALLPSHVGVTWPGGGNAVHLTDWKPLAGRDVIIWPDRDRQRFEDGAEKPYDDQPGTIAAAQIAQRLRDVARSVVLLRVDGLDVKDGWDAADALAEGWTDAETLDLFARCGENQADRAADVHLPYGFELTETGLYFAEEPKGEGGAPTRIRVAGRFAVSAKTRDLGGSAWGRLLEWTDDDQRRHRMAIPCSMLAGDGASIREALLDQGLYVGTSSKARGKLQEFLASVDTPVRARAVDRVGWANDRAFALPEETIGDAGGERIIFQSAGQAPHPYYSAGSLDGWKAGVAQLAIGNSRIAFAICASLAGPLLGPCGEESGGANFRGASSTGKTTVLQAGASSWGHPRTFIRTWRATANGLEGTASQHSETFLCLDELSQASPGEAGACAYMLANEQGKVRANRAGAARASAQWRVNFLSTGEISLNDLMRDNRTGRTTAAAGQEVRVLDLPADAGEGLGLFETIHGAASADAFARQIKAAARQNYGWAGPAFVREIIPIRDQLPTLISNVVAEFTARYVPLGADGQVHRAARRFGLYAAAGELARDLGILPWPEGEATRSAAAMFRGWLEHRGGSGSAEERNYVRTLALFLEKHGSSRFSAWDTERTDAVQERTVERAGFWRGREGDDRREHLIFPQVFHDIFAGVDAGQAAKVLREKHILIPGSDGKNSKTVRLPGLGSARMYVIGPEIFDAEG
ncbi:MAG TPA: DUF927 domain-containing protein [Allosphingosinicella sp.]|jgi:uncharacterized protein (DUF927 family)